MEAPIPSEGYDPNKGLRGNPTEAIAEVGEPKARSAIYGTGFDETFLKSFRATLSGC